MKERIRVLVVDDSIVVRQVVTEVLTEQSDIEVVAGAGNGRVALEKVRLLKPDLIILDIEMPEMDGLTVLAHLRETEWNIPVIMFSSHTELGAAATLEALSRGAADFFPKPRGSGGLEASRQVIRSELVPAIRALVPQKTTAKAATESIRSAPLNAPARAKSARIDVLAIGASTGGPNALADVFATLPADLPVPILVVQHMPPLFTQIFAERLTKISRITTVEAASGMELVPGKAWIAPGDHHLILAREGSVVRTLVCQSPPENACRPAVDPLLRSIADIYGPNCLAVILTGMGRDGLSGCQAIRAAGGQILAQDEATSVVWGMPGFVAKAGLADKVLPLSMIGGEIVRRVSCGRE